MPRRKPTPTVVRGRQSSVEEIAGRIVGPAGSQKAGFVVKSSVREDRRYTCPYCNGWIEPGSPHVVAYPVGHLDQRRHYHGGCWTKHSSTSGS